MVEEVENSNLELEDESDSKVVEEQVEIVEDQNQNESSDSENNFVDSKSEEEEEDNTSKSKKNKKRNKKPKVHKHKSTSFLLFKELFRSLFKNFKQLTSVIAISFLSLCLFAGLASNADNIQKREANIYRETNLASLYVTTTGLDSSDNEYFEGNNLKDTTINKRIYMNASLEEEDIYMISTTSSFYNDGSSGDHMTFDPSKIDKDSLLSKPKILEGEEGVLLMNAFMKKKDLSIGDSVHLNIQNVFKNQLEDRIESENGGGNGGGEGDSQLPPEYDVSFEKIKNFFDKHVKEGEKNFLFENEINFEMKVTGRMYHPEGVQNSEFSASVMEISNAVLIDTLTTKFFNSYDVEGMKVDIKTEYDNLDPDIKKFIEDLYEYIYPGESFDINKYLDYLTEENIRTEFTNEIHNLSNQVLINPKVKSTSDKLLEDIKLHFDGKDNFIIGVKSSSLPSYQALNQDVTQAMKLTFVFPVIFFLVSVLIIVTTLSQIILKNRTQIGIMKAVGIKKFRIYMHYILFGVVLCFIGGLLGFFIGPAIIPNVMSIKYNLLWDIPKASMNFFHPYSIIVFLVLLVVAGLVSFLLSFSMIRERPSITLRPKVSKPRKNKGNMNSFYSKKTSIPFRMAIRNIFKNKVKSVMVCLGMLGCTSLLVCGFGISNTLKYDVNLDYEVNQYIDLKVEYKTSISTYDKEDVNNELVVLKDNISNIEGVNKVEEVYQNTVSIFSSDYNVDSILTMFESTESAYFKVPYYVDKGLTMDETTAKNLNVKKNDTVKVTLNGKSYERKITHIFKSSVMHGIFDLKSEYETESKKNIYIPICFHVDLVNKKNQKAVKDEIMKLDLVSNALTHTDLLNYADDLLSTINKMTDVIKIFAILLCIVVIYNLSSLNLTERKRDIATMKVLGFHFKEINETLIYEISILSFVGTLIGLGVGYPLMVLVMMVNQTNLLSFVFHINWYTYLIAFAISFVVSVLISFIMNLKIKKVPMAESLKSVE